MENADHMIAEELPGGMALVCLACGNRMQFKFPLSVNDLLAIHPGWRREHIGCAEAASRVAARSIELREAQRGKEHLK